MVELKNYCPLPFGHITVDTLGNYRICCRHQHQSIEQESIYNMTHQQWFDGKYINDVRQSFLQDKQHPGCSICWKHENNGFESYRQASITEHKILKTNVTRPTPSTVEIQMGNLCNLGCLMCNAWSSSYINSENKKIDLESLDQKNLTFTADKKQMVLDIVKDPEVKILNFRGGEPLYSKLIYETLDEIPDQRKQSLMLHVTTNATQWNSRWQQLFSKFRLVRFMFSVDATGELYNYIRYPGDWNTTQKNILEIITQPNVKPLISCVVQNLNIMNLKSLFEFANRNHIHLNLDPTVLPEYIHFTNLPSDNIAIAIKRLDDILAMKLHQKNLHQTVERLKIMLEQQLESNQQHPEWQNFLDYINKKDQHRGKNVWDHLV